jgi:hypothetical protein
MTRLEEVEKYGLNTIDKKHLLAHLSGEKLTPMQTIHSKCYECMGYYVDGKADCGIETCPNYPMMRYNPHRIVKKRNLTDEQRKELSIRFKNIKREVK